MFRYPITHDEVKAHVSKIPTRKAGGWDMISPEHIKYGGEELIKMLQIICNAITYQEYIPVNFRQGVLIPVPKGKANAMLPTNNRGITLLTVINKLYERVLLGRMEQWIEGGKIIEDVQGAGQKHVSCLHTSLIARETIEYNLENGKNVYVCNLDAQKAFDTVWTNGLLYKLYKAGMDTKLWRIIKKLYSNFQCCVAINGVRSESFPVTQGVHQGAPLSMRLYQMFNNDLLHELKSSKLGAKMGHVEVACPTFADDISLIATSEVKLQLMVNIAAAHACRWRYKFNSNKSIIVSFGPKRADTLMGQARIEVVKECQHLGTILTTHAIDTDQLRKRIQECRGAFMAIKGLGCGRIPLGPKAASKLYEKIIIPKLLYGIEIMSLSEGAMEAMESLQRDIAKISQGLPRNVANPATLPMLGWLSINARKEAMQLMFLWRTLMLPIASTAKQVCLIRTVQFLEGEKISKGPIANIMETAKKYGLQGEISIAVVTAEYMPLRLWRKIVYNKIGNADRQRQTFTCQLYSSLSIFRQSIVGSWKIWPWWEHASRYPKETRRCQVMARMLVGARASDIDNQKMCDKCTSFKLETLAHILFECELEESVRILEWEKTKAVTPPVLTEEIERMDINKRTVFILSGLGGQYTPEWGKTYSSLANFITKVFKCRVEAL